jgi:mannose-6-phosphate isomerase
MPRVWGGSRLAGLGRTGAAGGDEPIGESWELADLPLDIPGGRTRIARGPGAGGTLRELIDRDPRAVLGDARPAEDGGFPLLVKLLDARMDLSVQVHPTHSYAAAHPEARVKSEAWVVMAADPDARILRGFRPDADGSRRRSAESIRAAALDGTIVAELEEVPARVGDCHVLPTGLCHALGGGTLVIEVQTPSDTTFRLFDWGRDGRELHLDAAVECLTAADAPLDPIAATHAGASDPAAAVNGPPRLVDLAQTEAFVLHAVLGGSGGRLDVSIPHRPVVLIGLEGTLHLDGPDGPVTIGPGDTVLLPAAMGDAVARLEPGARVVRAIPAPDGLGSGP